MRVLFLVYNDPTEIVRDVVMNQTRMDLNCHKSPDGFFHTPEDIKPDNYFLRFL